MEIQYVIYRNVQQQNEPKIDSIKRTFMSLFVFLEKNLIELSFQYDFSLCNNFFFFSVPVVVFVICLCRKNTHIHIYIYTKFKQKTSFVFRIEKTSENKNLFSFVFHDQIKRISFDMFSSCCAFSTFI